MSKLRILAVTYVQTRIQNTNPVGAQNYTIIINKLKNIYHIYKLYWVKLKFVIKNYRQNYKYRKLNGGTRKIYLKIFFNYSGNT